MTALAVPSRNQIVAQVEAVLSREAGARAIAIRSDREGAWPSSLAVAGREFALRWCSSALAVRDCLDGIEADEAAHCLLLTPLPESELGADVLSRLARARVFEVENWEIVRQLFRATEIDARLARHGWIANVLVEQAPPDGYAPVASGFLDLDTAWKAVLESTLGLPGPRPDLVQLLGWTASVRDGSPLSDLPELVRAEIAEWIGRCAGATGALVVEAVLDGRAADAVPLGLVCGVVFAPAAQGVPELAAAAVRLERYVGGRRLAIVDGRRWSAAATEALRALAPPVTMTLLDRADELLRELHVDAHAGLSDLLPAGLEARLLAFAEALQAQLDGAGSADEVARRAEAILCHGLATRARARVERVRMAVRLARWLATTEPAPPAGRAWASGYAREGAFVDLARMKLMGGDELARLSAAYGVLADRVRDRRDRENLRFARAVQYWNHEGGEIDDGLPVEQLIDRVLAPVAAKSPVLLLVVDGLSLSIFEELVADVTAHGWMEVVPQGRVRALVGIAAFPTITEVSRASLLSGRLAAGGANVEKSAFSSHPALVAASRAGRKPVLFHKGELGDVSGLSPEVRAAIAERDQRVVGVVFNAVDDNLGGSDQLHPRWTLDDLRLLKPLLHEARLAGRALVVSADHGHVLEERSVQRTSSEGDRWRLPGASVEPDECLLAGGRVMAPGGADRVICAASELVRFGGKKNGYHGGVTPQEVLVPMSVFAPTRAGVDGWVAAAPRGPDWWEPVAPSAASVAEPTARPPAPAQVRRAAHAAAQEDLFGGLAEQSPAQDWIAALLGSATYVQQRRLVARVAPQDADMRALLEALHARGGKLTKTALAQRLNMPLVRVSGFVNAARRVLNVDQAPVVELDEHAGEVRLNRELLALQFQVTVR